MTAPLQPERPKDVLADIIGRLGLPGLLVARSEARRLIDEDGVRATPGARTDWVIDPLPLVIPAPEWAALERGLQQRARLLDAVLADLYGERRTLKEGLLPPELIGGHRSFLAPAQGMRLPAERQLVLTGTDVARIGTDWLVLGDRSAVPAGAGYAMVNRRIIARALATIHRGTPLRRLRDFFDTMRMTLDGLAPGQDRQPKIALLWPGADSEHAYEMGFLAAILGTSLVSGGDIVVRDGRLFIDAPDRQAQLDVLLRRVPAADADPLEFPGGRRLGTPGLVEAARGGRVSIANPLGADVLDSPGLLPFLPRVARSVLSEDLLLGSADTYWCGDAASCSHVLTHVDKLILRPADRGSGASVQGWTLSESERDDLSRRIAAEPWAWVGQDPLFASTAPTVSAVGLTERRVVLRTFGVAVRDGYRIMPGGLARVARDDDVLKVSRRGVLAKDVWVLDDEASPIALSERPWGATASPSVQPWAGRVLAPRVADSLYWFGRYTERLDATARLLRLAIDLSEDYADRPDSMGHAVFSEVSRTLWKLHGLALESAPSPADSRAALRRMSVDSAVEGSLAQCFDGLQRCAYEVPTVMSGDVWHIIAALRRRLDALANDPFDYQTGLLDIRQSTLALFGVAAESLMKDNSWALIDAGVRLERAVSTMQLISTMFAAERPLMVLSRLSDVVMEACDSQITHRRRSLAGIGPTDPMNACAALLVLERANPRGVIPQLERLVEDMMVLADERLAGRVRDMIAALEASTPGLAEGNPATVSGILSDAVATASFVKAELKERHFTRRAPEHAQQIAWSNGVAQPMVEWSSQL